MEFLQMALDFVQNHLMGLVGIVATVLEIGFRLLPTKKPLSILHMISKGMKMMAKILEGASSFLDKVLPQNIVEEKKTE
jgi:hypothetical protein